MRCHPVSLTSGSAGGIEAIKNPIHFAPASAVTAQPKHQDPQDQRSWKQEYHFTINFQRRKTTQYLLLLRLPVKALVAVRVMIIPPTTVSNTTLRSCHCFKWRRITLLGQLNKGLRWILSGHVHPSLVIGRCFYLGPLRQISRSHLVITLSCSHSGYTSTVSV